MDTKPYIELVRAIKARSREEIQTQIDACHPCEVDTDDSYLADECAMELIHFRHDKRTIVNLIRWLIMGCPTEEDSKKEKVTK